MRRPIAIADDAWWVGVNDRETDLFETIWPLPDGISYNAYVVRGRDRVAVIDTVKKNSFGSFLEKVRTAIGADTPVDYLVINHIEPDHSGSVKLLREAYPDVEIVGNQRTLEFLSHLYGLEENVHAVEDGEELDLGGHSLKFLLAPMVHWPETMMSYDAATGVLFSGDAFGGFGALNGVIFDDEVDQEYFEDEILRYFANIIGKFGATVRRAIDKARDLDIRVVASTHGPVWREEPQRIIDDYYRWAGQQWEPGAVVACGSMYGNATGMMEAVAGGLRHGGLKRIRVHDAARTHVSYIIRDAWKYGGLVLGTATYDQGIFPPMNHLVHLLKGKRLQNRVLGIFGTYGWSGGGVSGLTDFAEAGDYDLVEPVVEARFSPTDEDLEQCHALGVAVARRVLERAE